MSFERRVEQLCAVIMEHPPEFWEERNKAMLELTSLVGEYEHDASMYEIQEVFTSQIFRLLREAVKSMISDLRSQQIRDTCLFLIKLSSVCKDHVRHFLRDTFSSLLDALKVPNKVMSAYVDDCIRNMIGVSNFRGCIPLIVMEIKESKAKGVRERCIDYVHLILEMWDLGEKDGDLIYEAVRTGLEDASVRSRENARFAFLAFRAVFPRRAERLASTLPPAILNRIDKIELELQGDGDSIVDESKRKARRMSHVDEAVASIQALMRGALTRRLSSSAGGPEYQAEEDGADGDTRDNNQDTLNTSAVSTASQGNFDHAEPPPDSVCIGARAVVGDVTRVPSIVGTIKFVGLTLFSSGFWVGLELDAPIGKNDGSVQGKQYFTCPPNKGIFVRANQVNTAAAAAATTAAAAAVDDDNNNNGDDAVNSRESEIEAPSPSSASFSGVPSSPGSGMGRTVKANNKTSVRSLGLLKLKISQAMDILSQQLEIAEQLDAFMNGGGRVTENENVRSMANADVKGLLLEAQALNDREKSLCEDFGAEMSKLTVL